MKYESGSYKQLQVLSERHCEHDLNMGLTHDLSCPRQHLSFTKIQSRWGNQGMKKVLFGAEKVELEAEGRGDCKAWQGKVWHCFRPTCHPARTDSVNAQWEDSRRREA